MQSTTAALPWWGPQLPAVLLAAASAAVMLGALGLLLSVYIKQLENFAGTMNFVIFPMYFLSTALYPLWKLEESGARWIYEAARFNPFTHAVEWMRFALYGKDPGWAPWIVLGCAAVFFIVACNVATFRSILSRSTHSAGVSISHFDIPGLARSSSAAKPARRNP